MNGGFIEPEYGFAVNVCVYSSMKKAQLAKKLVLKEFLKLSDGLYDTDIVNEIKIVPCNGQPMLCVEV